MFQVEHTDLKGSHAVWTVDHIVSCEWMYADVAVEGETISCRGKLESVKSSSGISHKILVGSPEAGETDYLLPFTSRCRLDHFLAS